MCGVHVLFDSYYKRNEYKIWLELYFVHMHLQHSFAFPNIYRCVPSIADHVAT